ncbi:hypothetical protein V8B97DRAFT_1914171 [Scleroderma yunnanense]
MSTTPIPGTPPVSTSSAADHLWIPEPEPDHPIEQSTSTSRSAQLLRDRLYVGNLGSVVDEYALLQVFSKYGKVSKLDFLFHKSGPNKGKPRGYAFIEFANETDAGKALENTNGKPLRGRKLVVTFAHQAPLVNPGNTAAYGGRTKRADNTPTTLSLVKSTGVGRSEMSATLLVDRISTSLQASASSKTSSKIAMMEAKLRQMESSSPFTEKPSLPPKPVSTAESQFPKRSASRRPILPLTAAQFRPPEIKHLATHKHQEQRAIQSESDNAGREIPAVSAPRDQTEPSDMTNPPASRKQGIPGVKIVKSRPK